MELAIMTIQVIVGLGILNVWLVRRDKDTPFRAKNAKTMKEEFLAYGLPEWSVPVIGAMKIICALMILIGLVKPSFTAIGAASLGVFMLAAVLFHLKVRDSFLKTVPALLMLCLCCFLALSAQPDILSVAQISN